MNSSAATHAEIPLLGDFLTELQDRTDGPRLVARVERTLGEELIRQGLSAASPEEALAMTGTWFDVPKPPKFKDIDEVAADTPSEGISFGQIFPVDLWTQAYTSYSYNVRIFAFSQFVELVAGAGRKALEQATKIRSDDFYQRIMRVRAKY
jgi:hypothetical protein